MSFNSVPISVEKYPEMTINYLLDKAESGEVVKISRNGVVFYVGTSKGVSDGQKRVVDAAINFGAEMQKHENDSNNNNFPTRW